VIVKLVVTGLVLVGVTGFWLKLQLTPAGKFGQLNVTGEVKPLLGVTVTVIELVVWPALTLGVVGVAERANGAVTVKPIEAAWWLNWLNTPVDAVITIVLVPGLVAGIVATVCVVPGGVTVVGLNEHDCPVGNPEQEKFTAWLKLLIGVTVIVALPLCPEATVKLVVGELAEKSGRGLVNATARLFTSSDPSPVTRSYPAPAE
jgi:hypothetical protein